MCLYDITAENLVGANTAVVWPLWSWETVLGPTVWPVVWAEEGVFLLQTEPGLMLGIGFHESSSFVTVVELVRAAIVIPRLAHDKDVVATAERVGEYGNGAKVDIGIVAGSLATG